MADAAAAPVLLALQGGGAHGAFTWGVLDRLLEEDDFRIEAISGTSSGAVNAVALVQGFMDGGRDGARESLARLWERIGNKSALANWGLGKGGHWLLELTRHLTPAQMNPLGINPLANLLEDMIDFERLRSASPIRLHLAATRVRDGALVMFSGEQVSLDAVMASACLPQMFRTVVIDDESYWDGGYAGNPALAPLVFDGRARDILSILVQPLESSQSLNTAKDISSRVMELAFSTTFLREMEYLATSKRLLRGKLSLTPLGRRIQQLRLHLIEPGEDIAAGAGRVPAGMDTQPKTLTGLYELGRTRATDWLGQAWPIPERSNGASDRKRRTIG